MKLNPAQLSQHLTKSLASIYLVHGDEPLLVTETIDAIHQAARTAGFNERVAVATDAGADWGKHLYADTHSISLFSEKKIIDINLNHIKLTANNSKLLEEYANKPISDTLLILQSDKLDTKTEKSNWFKAIEKQGIVIPIWPISPDQLPAWLMQRAKKVNLTITRQGAEWLATQMEGHLLAAAQEIEKLALLQPHGTLDEHTIQSAVTDNARFDIFSFVDNVLLGKIERSLRILQNLAAEDTEPTLILWALTRELRTLTEIQRKSEEGTPLANLFSSLRIWEKRQPIVKAALQRHPNKTYYWNLLLHAAKIDNIIKGAARGNVWDELQKLAISFA